MDNNKEMIEGLVSQILDDYHDDKIINQQALFIHVHRKDSRKNHPCSSRKYRSRQLILCPTLLVWQKHINHPEK